ncbi:MAG: methyltransferase domain-containing protein [Cyanobium sp.]
MKQLFIQGLRLARIPGWRNWRPKTDTNPERYLTTKEFLSIHARDFLSRSGSSSLDLECGNNPRNPFLASIHKGLDLHEYPEACITSCDLSISKIPFDADTFDFITAFDFLEHIPRVAIVNGCTTLPFISLMNEIHRALKPGGLFYSQTPASPCKEAFSDPTHINIITEDTFVLYFSNDHWARIYGFEGHFRILGQEWCRPSLLTLIQKIE